MPFFTHKSLLHSSDIIEENSNMLVMKNILLGKGSISVAVMVMDLVTGGTCPPLFHKFICKVPLFSLHSALLAHEGALEYISPHFLNASYVLDNAYLKRCQ